MQPFTRAYAEDDEQGATYSLHVIFRKMKGKEQAWVQATKLFPISETTAVIDYRSAFVGSPDGGPEEMVRVSGLLQALATPPRISALLRESFVQATQEYGDHVATQARPTIGSLQVATSYRRTKDGNTWRKMSEAHHRRVLVRPDSIASVVWEEPSVAWETFDPNEEVETVPDR